jgi:hypothetical protein
LIGGNFFNGYHAVGAESVDTFFHVDQ